MESKTLLWLDDVRDPEKRDWLNFSCVHKPSKVVWVKSYDEFINWIMDNGLPEGINFDHDLGIIVPESTSDEEVLSFPLVKMETGYWRSCLIEEKTGLDCAKWLCDYCLDNKLDLPKYYVHSANPIGKENIIKYLENFKKHNG